MLRQISRCFALLLLLSPLLAACGSQTGVDAAKFAPMFKAAQASAMTQPGAVATADALAKAQKSTNAAANASPATAARPDSWQSLLRRLSARLRAAQPGTTTHSATHSSFWDRVYQRYRELSHSSRSNPLPIAQ